LTIFKTQDVDLISAKSELQTFATRLSTICFRQGADVRILVFWVMEDCGLSDLLTEELNDHFALEADFQSLSNETQERQFSP
jgi:hypothetical protein